MRKLIVMCGCPGSGKSTLIKELGLENNTLSPDKLRLMFSGCDPMVDKLKIGISQKDNYRVFKEMFYMLENRMNLGLLTVIDACHCNERDIDKYKILATKYNYDVILVNFKVDKNELLERNKNREFSVPDEVIERMYHEKQNMKIPAFVKKISPSQLADEIRFKFTDISKYKKVVMVGDIHGCYTALQLGIPSIDFNTFYIFCGDYIDRGLENVETLKWFFQIMKRPNVVLLKGNHELNLQRYVNGEETYGRAFPKTRDQIEEANLSMKDLKDFCRLMQGSFAFVHNGRKVVLTHGGISHIENMNLCSEYGFIMGSGNMNTNIDEVWTNNVKDIVQVHGHRNEFNLPIKATYNSYNLEGSVELGKQLRMLILDKGGFTVHSVDNKVFDSSALKYEIADEDY